MRLPRAGNRGRLCGGWPVRSMIECRGVSRLRIEKYDDIIDNPIMITQQFVLIQICEFNLYKLPHLSHILKAKSINQMNFPPQLNTYPYPSHPQQLSSYPTYCQHPLPTHLTAQAQHLLPQQEVELRRRSTWSCGDFTTSGYHYANNYNQVRQEECMRQSQQTGRVEMQNGNKREGQKYKNNYNAQYQGQQHYNNNNNNCNNWRYRQQYPKQNMEQNPQCKENQKQLSRLQEIIKQAKADKIHKQNICNQLRTHLSPGNQNKNPIQLLREIIASRQKVHQTDTQTNNQQISRLYQQSRVLQIEHEEKYKKMGVYMKMNKQKEENQKLSQNITRKEQQLKSLSARKQSMTADITKQRLTKQQKLQDVKQKTKQLDSKIESTKKNLQKWTDLRFKLNQKFLKQERLNKDITERIANVDDHIQKEAQADERIRLGNLKLMENLQCQYEDLSHEKLRILSEKNHQLKLQLLSSTKILKEKETDNKNIVPSELIVQKETQIKALLNQIAGHENKIKASQEELEEIKQLTQKIQSLQCKQKLKIDCDRIKVQIDTLQQEYKEREAECEELKTTINGINHNIRECTDNISIELKKLRQLKQKKKQEQEKNRIKENQAKVGQEKQKKQVKQVKGSSKNNRTQGKKLQKETKQQTRQVSPSYYYVDKKFKPLQFLFTLSYLVILIFLALWYESRQHKTSSR